MKLFALLMVGILIGSNDKNPLDYRTAYEKASNGDKPLLVLVTAEWCAPCKTMKSTTIPQLIRKDAFRDFHYATVDLDKEEDLARKLIGNRGVPQLIVYEKKDNRWQRRYLRGIQTAATVEKFISSGIKTRTASKTSQSIGK